jgi:hypothetical protein
LLVAGLLASTAFCPTFAAADMAQAQAAIASGDYAAAAQALRPLAAAGRADAQYQLAKLAFDGRDVGLKPDQALSLLVQAAAQGNGQAQARLGLAYAKGENVAQNDLAAYQWLSRASVSPDLSEIERSVVTTNRTVILNRLAPSLAAGVDLEKAAAAQAPLPSKPEPSGSIAAVPLFSDAAPASTSSSASADGADSRTTVLAAALPAVGAIDKDEFAGPPMTEEEAGKLPFYRVQIASLPDRDSAEAEKKRLLRKYPKLLADLEIDILYTDIGNKMFRHRLVIGPFKDRSAADARCTKLKAVGQDCIVGFYLLPPKS